MNIYEWTGEPKRLDFYKNTYYSFKGINLALVLFIDMMNLDFAWRRRMDLNIVPANFYPFHS